MDNKIIDIKIKKTPHLPNGIYLGVMASNKIELSHGGVEYILTTEEGIRGFGMNVIVESLDGTFTYGLIKN